LRETQARGLEPFFPPEDGPAARSVFSGTKLAWLLDHVPGARRRAEKGELAFARGHLVLWQLTGGRVHATDVSNASRTLLLNLRTATGTTRCCARFAFPRGFAGSARSSASLARCPPCPP